MATDAPEQAPAGEEPTPAPPDDPMGNPFYDEEDEVDFGDDEDDL